MSKLLRVFAALLFVVTVFAAHPAAAQSSCDYLVTCFSDLPEHLTAQATWQYSHQCCDLQDHATIWHVYVDFRGRWHLVLNPGPYVDP
jgi:hypothetical protein